MTPTSWEGEGEGEGDDNNDDMETSLEQCWYIAIDTLSTIGSLFSSIPPHLIVRDSGT
jgi:hypothetical protein